MSVKIEIYTGPMCNYCTNAKELLNRHLPIDLREKSFPINSLSTTVFHHCTVMLWRSDKGYEIFLPRAFSLSLWELIRESAEQFGYTDSSCWYPLAAPMGGTYPRTDKDYSQNAVFMTKRKLPRKSMFLPRK